jgi:hypothetical protein
MANRALIGRLRSDGVEYTSVNFDGYLSHVGMLLMNAWSDETALDALFAEGKVSSLGVHVGSRHDGGSFPAPEGHEHDTVFYHRDRNQPREDTETQITDLESFLATEKDVNYIYLRRDGEWFVSVKKSQGTVVPLRDALRDTFAVVSILDEDDDGFILSVEIEEEEQGWREEKSPKLGEVLTFLDDTASGSWEWINSKVDENRMRVRSDAAVVAMKLRFNIEDHEDRFREATA